MSNSKATRTVTINNRAGVHARSAVEIAKRAGAFNAEVWLVNTKTQLRAEGSAVLQILSLGAWLGDELLLEASGPDAQRAVDELAEFIANHLHEYDS